MKRDDLTEKILDIKRAKGWSWKYICAEIGGMSPMLITGALLGQMKLTKPQAAKAAELFGLSNGEEAMLNEVPMRGTPMPPTDPLIYRFYELVMLQHRRLPTPPLHTRTRAREKSLNFFRSTAVSALPWRVGRRIERVVPPHRSKEDRVPFSCSPAEDRGKIISG